VRRPSSPATADAEALIDPRQDPAALLDPAAGGGEVLVAALVAPSMASWRAGLPFPPSRRTVTTPVIPSPPTTAGAVVAPSTASVVVAPSTVAASSDGAACPGVAVLAVEACGVAVLWVDACPGGDPGGGLVVSPAAVA
jgi:hypothetical protein